MYLSASEQSCVFVYDTSEWSAVVDAGLECVATTWFIRWCEAAWRWIADRNQRRINGSDATRKPRRQKALSCRENDSTSRSKNRDGPR